MILNPTQFGKIGILSALLAVSLWTSPADAWITRHSGDWSYDVERDEWTGRYNIFGYILNSNGEGFHVQCADGEMDILLSFRFPGGNVRFWRMDYYPIQYRVGFEIHGPLVFNRHSKGNVLFAPAHEVEFIINNLAGHRSVLFRSEPDNARPRTSKFSLIGADNVFHKVLAACGR